MKSDSDMVKSEDDVNIARGLEFECDFGNRDFERLENGLQKT